MLFNCTAFRSARNRSHKVSLRGLTAGAGLLGIFAFTALSQSAPQAAAPGPAATNLANPEQITAAGLVADAGIPTKISGQPPQLQDDPAAEQRRQIARESAQLLQMALELKKAVDNSDACTLSMHIVRKAGSIAKLAHGVKEEMKHPATQR
jgi:hypothetical protein